MFKIERNVPIPNKFDYPWADMKNGNSILIPLNSGDISKIRNAAVLSARNYLKKNRPGWKIVTRKEGDAVRIWLVDSNPKIETKSTKLKKVSRKRR